MLIILSQRSPEHHKVPLRTAQLLQAETNPAHSQLRGCKEPYHDPDPTRSGRPAVATVSSVHARSQVVLKRASLIPAPSTPAVGAQATLRDSHRHRLCPTGAPTLVAGCGALGLGLQTASVAVTRRRRCGISEYHVIASQSPKPTSAAQLPTSAAGVVVSCKIPILATRVRFPGGAAVILLFPHFKKIISLGHYRNFKTREKPERNENHSFQYSTNETKFQKMICIMKMLGRPWR